MENAFEKEKDVFEREMLNEFMKARHMPKQAIQQQLLQKQSIYNRQGYPVITRRFFYVTDFFRMSFNIMNFTEFNINYKKKKYRYFTYVIFK